MPYKEQTKFNKGALYFLFAVIIFFAALILNISNTLKIAIVVADIAAFLFIRRGYIMFNQAVKQMKKGNNSKTMSLFQNALKAGVGDEQKVYIGTFLIQQGSFEQGCSILNSVITQKTEGTLSIQNSNRAKIALSSALWIQNDREGAVRILEQVKESGYTDGSLYTNLSTYYLAGGQIEKAKKLITEAVKKDIKYLGFEDNRGWLYILEGKWDKAKEIYEVLINDRSVGFPEAYLHGAQVALHENNMENVINYLGWGFNKTFTATGIVTKEYFNYLLNSLQNSGAGNSGAGNSGAGNSGSEENSFARLMEKNKEKVACGIKF